MWPLLMVSNDLYIFVEPILFQPSKLDNQLLSVSHHIVKFVVELYE